ncbi:hypothetical protein [Nocardia sp. NPDC020380]|uniref:hypothetical protein n=1 Tax=Nocardia sp. NPDC020380 TaxID=3364309 RepID=UPI003788868F
MTGFSQGGEAATAVGEALQANQIPGFGLAALAPISGPYDVQHVEFPAGVDGRVSPADAVFYFAYWLTSMNRIYHLYDNPAEAFQPPYTDAAELFDGKHDEAAIGKALPPTPDKLLQPAFVSAALANPTGPLLQAMNASDGTCDWTPHVPVHLYAASGDRNVPIANAQSCLAALHTDQATLTDLGQIDHTTTVHVALPQILTWFQQQVPAT